MITTYKELIAVYAAVCFSLATGGVLMGIFFPIAFGLAALLSIGIMSAVLMAQTKRGSRETNFLPQPPILIVVAQDSIEETMKTLQRQGWRPVVAA